MKRPAVPVMTVALILLLSMGYYQTSDRNKWHLVDAVSAATRPGQSVVGLVRSDYPKLKQPAAPEAQLSEAQIEAMVDWAVNLAGGLQTVINPDADWIAIKVNIVEVKKPGSGVITDPRVVKAVVKLAHQAAPEARISIVEGPGEWIAPDVPGADTTMAQVEDGWAAAGYRDLLRDPELGGIRLDLVDLNIDEAILTPVPEPWYAREKYWVPRTVLECDALIDVPVMKIHDGPGMTCAMKNFVGIAPGLKYGWHKAKGVPGQGPGIPHTSQIIDETIVDLTSLANPAFTVVDAVVAMERFKTDRHGGRPVRLNAIVAGADIAAVDATCARLMGLNPDDLEFLTLAAHKGLGQIDGTQIKINGQTVEKVGKRFEKTPPTEGPWAEMGHYGQGNRTWLLKGPLAARDFGEEFLDPATARPASGADGWSGPVYFSDDRIDLDKYFDGPADCVAYGYAEFAVPRDGPAELWVGSDESLAVWIDGREVYRFAGARRHQLPNDRVPVVLTAGDHRLLVKAGQSRGKYGFSLNLCAVEPDPRYEGNRVEGLKFRVPAADGKAATSVKAEAEIRPSSQARVLESARWVMNPSTLVGAIEGGLKAMGDSTRSTAYLTGITGFAFRLAVSDSLSWDDPGIDRLVPDMDQVLGMCGNLGYTFEMVRGNERDPGARDRMNEIWKRVRDDLDRGVPAILHRWGCFLIRGYDPRQETYLLSQWDQDELVSFDEIADEHTGAFAAIFFGARQPVDGRQAERASLRFAVEQAHLGDAEGGRIANGFKAYERWIGALEKGTGVDPWAHAFHAMLLLGARQQAAAYLDTLAGTSGKRMAAPLRQAAESYRKEVESLTVLNQLFGFEPPGQPERVNQVEEQKKGAALLEQALKWEKKAIAGIEQALKADQGD
jgi:uncharacterized protein (DUF362 family)